MPVPDYQSLMLPVLQQAAAGEVRISDVIENLGIALGLSDDELAETLPSGKQTTFANRVHWAKTYLKQAGLVESTRRGYFSISDRGKKVLSSGIQRVDVGYLLQFAEFQSFRARNSEEAGSDTKAVGSDKSLSTNDETPDDLIRRKAIEINSSVGEEIIDRILSSSPAFFERVVVSLLIAMGYGGSLADAGRAIGRSGDDGVDGVVDQDTLGLDRIYLQAKRYKPDSSIGPGAVRDFFGSLDMHKATKGLFVTTSTFSKSAVETAEKLGKRIVLIDGQQLAKLLVKFNIGCRLQDSIEIKKIDEEFFA